MLHKITGIDHVGIDPGDIWQAFSRFSRLGFTVSTPSRFRAVPVESCQVTFADHFLSISTSFSDPQYSGSEWVARTKPIGITELMLGTDNMPALKTELQARFADLLNASAAADVERRIYLHNEIRYQRFRILVLAPGSVPGIGTLGFCEHQTRELVWRPELLSHANGAIGISTLTFQHPDPPSLEVPHGRLFGKPRSKASADQTEIHLSGINVRFVTAKRLHALCPGFNDWSRLRASDLKIIEVEVSDLVRTREHLQFMGVSIVESDPTRVVVNPEDACGFLLGFSQKS